MNLFEVINTPTTLVNLFNDNPETEILSFIKKTGQRINFYVHKEDGELRILNGTPRAIYNSFEGPLNLKTTIYGNKAFIIYDCQKRKDDKGNLVIVKTGNWRDTLTDLIKIELYDNHKQLLDFMELETEDDSVNDYNNQFRQLKFGQSFLLKTKWGKTFKGLVHLIESNEIRFNFTGGPKNININAKVDLTDGKPFFLSNNVIYFEAEQILDDKTLKKIRLSDIVKFELGVYVKSQAEIDQEKKDAEAKRAKEKAEQEKKDKENADIQNKLDSEKRKEEAQKNAKLADEVYHTILNDPELRKAFYHQPKLLNLIKFGDPVGLIPAKNLVDRYINKHQDKKFKVNNTVTFEIVDQDMKVDEAKFVAPVGKVYKALVKEKEIGTDFIRLVHRKDATDPEFFVQVYTDQDPEEEKEHVYRAKIRVEYLSLGGQRATYPPSEIGKIKILSYNFR